MSCLFNESSQSQFIDNAQCQIHYLDAVVSDGRFVSQAQTRLNDQSGTNQLFHSETKSFIHILPNSPVLFIRVEFPKGSVFVWV